MHSYCFTCKTEQNRTVQLERTFKYHYNLFRAIQELKHVTEGIVQMSFGHWWAWGLNHLSRKLVPAFSHPHLKEFFPSVLSEPPLAPTNSVIGYQFLDWTDSFCSVLLLHRCRKWAFISEGFKSLLLLESYLMLQNSHGNYTSGCLTPCCI